MTIWSSLYIKPYDIPLLLPVQAVPYLTFWEVRRKDHWELLAHHLATIGLITYSYHLKYACFILYSSMETRTEGLYAV